MKVFVFESSLKILDWYVCMCQICISTGIIHMGKREYTPGCFCSTWWRHQMETFSALLAFCVGNSPVIGEFPAQRPVTRIFDVFFCLCLNQHLSKQRRRRWLETPMRLIWRHCNDLTPWSSRLLFVWWSQHPCVFVVCIDLSINHWPLGNFNETLDM